MEARQYLPLTETSFFILLSLSASPKHGYAIMKEVEALSEQRVMLAAGTLYSALRRMLDDGWIERVTGTASNGDSPERKLYRLSDLGRRIYDEETERLKHLVRLTRRIQAGAGT